MFVVEAATFTGITTPQTTSTIWQQDQVCVKRQQ